MRKPQIAILALQGAFIEHSRMFSRLGADVFEIRQFADLEHQCDALILPGGESTVQGKLLKELELFEPLKQRIISGLPVMATCAGIILLAEKLCDDDTVHFGTLPVTVRRNAYGRQLGSFYTEGNFGDIPNVTMPFIRAPQIAGYGENVSVLSSHNGVPTAVCFENQLAMTFHPEITEHTDIHEYFLKNIVIPYYSV